MTDETIKLDADWPQNTVFGESFAITGSIQPSHFTFLTSDNRDALKIERDRITVGEGVEVTEAAQAVLDALQGMLSERDRQVWNAAIDAAIENMYCEDSYYNEELWELLRGLKK